MHQFRDVTQPMPPGAMPSAAPATEETKWLAMLLRRIGIMIVKEVERRYDLPSSFDKRQ